MKLMWQTPLGTIVARFIAGMGGAGIFAVAATYSVEIATIKTRGLLGSLMIFFLNAGIVAMYVMGAYISYNVVLIIMVSQPIIFFVLMLRMPETPVFLAKNNRDKVGFKFLIHELIKLIRFNIEPGSHRGDSMVEKHPRR
jgi:MFS family permease